MNARIIAIAAAILFATAAFAAKPDVIVLRNGETQGGTLRSCKPDSCTLGKTLYKREAMAWIGFAADNAKPPLVTYNSEDEIHLRDRLRNVPEAFDDPASSASRQQSYLLQFEQTARCNVHWRVSKTRLADNS